jgi:RND family efflux transporter MFP subunit
MTGNVRMRVLGLLFLSAALLLAGCGGEEVSEPAPVVRPVKMLTVGAVSAESGPLSLPGRVEASDQVDLSFRVGGPLIELPVREGDEVRRGRLVARIDPRDFEIRLNSALAQQEKARADFDRISALYEKEAVSRAQLDQARSALDVTSAALEDARANLEDTSLRAPFSGTVGTTYVQNYQDVRPKEPILSLVNVRSVDVVVDVPERLIAGARGEEGGRLVARFDVAEGREFDLAMKEIAREADPRTQTYRATLTMPQPEGINVFPGMTATVVHYPPAGSQAAERLLVPAIAVFADEAGQSHVWVVDPEGMTVHRRAVATGDLSGSDRIEIVDGLDPGETIAVSAVSHLREGMQVRSFGE